jgi:hypothetical protein
VIHAYRAPGTVFALGALVAAKDAALETQEKRMKTEQLVQISDVELDVVAGGVSADAGLNAAAKANVNADVQVGSVAKVKANLGLCLDLGLGLGLNLGILKL